MALTRDVSKREADRLLRDFDARLGNPGIYRRIRLDLRYALLEALDRGHDLAMDNFSKPFEDNAGGWDKTD